jgi:hypothetical protein
MSVIKPVQPPPQQPRKRAIGSAESEQDEKLTPREVKIIAASAVGGIVSLTLIAWLLLPISSKIVPFVVAGALPLFTLFAIIYQAIVYHRQWQAMKDSLGRTDLVIEKMQSQLVESNNQTEVMKRALAESEKLTAHAKANLAITQEGIEHAQRAYLTVTQCIAGPAGFKLTIENSGNTPAREVAVSAITEPGFGNVEMPTEPMGNYRPVGLLGPRSPVHVFFAIRNLTSEEEGYYNDSEWGFHWFCRGQIFYRDIFQQEGDYWVVDFCFYLDQVSGDVVPDSSGNEVKRYRHDRQVPQPPS